MQEMAQIYGAQLARFNAENFLAQTSIDEGYLFPDTYFFLPDATRIDGHPGNAPGLRSAGRVDTADHRELDALISDIITMASIVEDEASNTQDREMIAGIFWRRIALRISRCRPTRRSCIRLGKPTRS